MDNFRNINTDEDKNGNEVLLFNDFNETMNEIEGEVVELMFLVDKIKDRLDKLSKKLY
jgi:hypothetical protein